MYCDFNLLPKFLELEATMQLIPKCRTSALGVLRGATIELTKLKRILKLWELLDNIENLNIKDGALISHY